MVKHRRFDVGIERFGRLLELGVRLELLLGVLLELLVDRVSIAWQVERPLVPRVRRDSGEDPGERRLRLELGPI
jgi:hypothetical protein